MDGRAYYHPVLYWVIFGRYRDYNSYFNRVLVIKRGRVQRASAATDPVPWRALPCLTRTETPLWYPKTWVWRGWRACWT
jgi:hypothetical protein